MSRLWPFAVALYSAPGVREFCLELQDEHDVDVPVLLAVVWLHGEGFSLDRTDLAGLCTVSMPWQTQVVGPLRNARRALRDTSRPGRALGIESGARQSLKADLQALELRAERLQLEALEGGSANWLKKGAAPPLDVLLAALAPRVEPRRWHLLVAAGDACRHAGRERPSRRAEG